MQRRSPPEVRDETGHLVRELHGVTLAQILDYLVTELGFSELAARVPIKCFSNDPSIKSSLVFLRRTPWARTRVEQLFVALRSRPARPPAVRGALDSEAPGAASEKDDSSLPG